MLLLIQITGKCSFAQFWELKCQYKLVHNLNIFFFMLAFESIIFALFLALLNWEPQRPIQGGVGVIENRFFFLFSERLFEGIHLGLWLLWRNIYFYKCKSHTAVFEMWLGISALDFLVNSSSHVQKNLECIGISSSIGQNQAKGMVQDKWKCLVILEARGQNCKQCRTSEVVAAVVNQRKEEYSRKKVQYWLLIASIPSTVPDVLYHRQVWLRQKNVLGEVINGVCYHPGCGWLVGEGDRSRPCHSILCF